MTKRILHLASFDGNVGDVLNHQGFYKGISEVTDDFPEITQFEIREFYRGNKKFDKDFVEYVNSFEGFVVGGGNYFELWVDHSPTGTSVMIDPTLFEQIKVPVLFNALGVDLGQGTTEKNVSNFKNFLDLVFAKENHSVSLRNDGALKNVTSLFGSEYAARFLHTPDAGFYAGFAPQKNEKKTALINLPGDMLSSRYPGGEAHTSDSFLDEFAELLIELLTEHDYEEVTLIPHIYKDCVSISSLLGRLPDKVVRERCRIAELSLGQDISRFKNYYESASLVFATRFHSNIAALKASENVVALENYVQISNLYEELDMPEKLLDVRLKGFRNVFFDNLKCGTTYANDRVDVSERTSKDYRSYITQVAKFFQ